MSNYFYSPYFVRPQVPDRNPVLNEWADYAMTDEAFRALKRDFRRFDSLSLKCHCLVKIWPMSSRWLDNPQCYRIRVRMFAHFADRHTIWAETKDGWAQLLKEHLNLLSFDFKDHGKEENRKNGDLQTTELVFDLFIQVTE